MTEETWRRIEAFRAGWLDSLAWPVPIGEVDAASAELGIPFPPDYREFVRRYGGGRVGAYPIFGLRISKAMAMSAGSTVVMENQRYRDEEWPGVSEWLIISSDRGGNPIGIAPDGQVWASNRDSKIIKTEAKNFEAFLSLCLDFSHDGRYGPHRWHMIHEAVAAEPVKPQPCLELFALSEASRNDIWDSPVMVQTLWSQTLGQSALLWPLDEAGLGWSSAKKNAPRPDWRVEVRLPWVRDPIPEITTSGVLKPLDADSPKAMVANAVLVICKQLVWMNGRIPLPTIIRSGEASDGYWVMFERLPMVFGGHTSYDLSRDLRRYQVMGGR
jgi:hypothetical protein